MLSSTQPIEAVFWIQIRIRIRIRMVPHHFGKLDTDPDQSEKGEALEGHFIALEGPNMGKIEW
jgi:hypothetical protein